MRIRLFLAFSLVTIISIGILGFMIQTNTQTTLTSFAQSGGFVGADRLTSQLSAYYLENSSWVGVEDYMTSGDRPANQTTQENGQRTGAGQGGMSGGNRFGAGGMRPGSFENFTLTDSSGEVIYTQNDELPAQLDTTILQNAIKITVNDQVVGYLIPENSLIDLSGIISENLSQALGSSLLTTILFSSIATLFLAFIFTYIFMQPIRQLTAAAQKLGQGDLSQRVSVGGGTEIKQMANTFNQMAASLQRSNQARKSMTADIAHELRTPLSVQRANLEALQDGVYPLTPENLAPIAQQNKLLTQLVEDLRTLALADTENLTLDRRPVNLGELIQQIYETFKPQFDQQGIQLAFSTDLTEPLILLLDAQRITQIISNLLENARRHTPQGGRVQLNTKSQPDSILITIKDSGEGIPPDSLPKIFDRFHRADQSRAREKGGTGLGLTIARRLAEAHNGTLTAENAPEGGAVFLLTLPKEEENLDDN